jgi:hypothetical protein
MRIPDTPFGEAACESEMRSQAHRKYSEMFFTATPFSDAATRRETYLIVGRRGSGKTALAQYLRFQSDLPDPIYIEVDEPAVFQQVLLEVATRYSENRVVAISELVRIWTYLLWHVIFEHLKDASPAIAAIAKRSGGRNASDLIRTLLTMLLPMMSDATSALESSLRADDFQRARDAARQLAQSRPIIIVLDTLEQYDTTNVALMNATAALVDCAATFNQRYSRDGIHLKVFMAGEIFPYLQ